MAKASDFLVALCDGHGLSPEPTPGKRTPWAVPGVGRVVYENEFNREVVDYLEIELKRCGINVLKVAPTDADTPLGQRTALANANKADIYVSIHFNAGGGEGIETFYHSESVKGKKLAQLVQAQLVKGTKQKDRGIKHGDHLWVIRKTSMPVILCECGFMDNTREAQLMLNTSFQKECAEEIAKGICEYFGVKYVSEDDVEPPVTCKPSPTPNAPSVPKYFGRLIQWGSKGDVVKMIQRRLNELGFGVLVVDELFKDKTESAVKRFQGSKGLLRDGIVGPKTWAKLFG